MSDAIKIKVLLADDHPLVLDGIRSHLEQHPSIEVVGEATNGLEALDLSLAHKPDVVVMDITMPVLSGIEALSRFTVEQPDVKVLMLSMHDNREYITRVMQAGAKGYILKDVPSEELTKAVLDVYQGKTYFSSNVTDALLSTPGAESRATLTEREKTILKYLAEGNSNKHVARALDISVRTVETHRRNIKSKLDVKTSAGLVRYAIESGLVDV